MKWFQAQLKNNIGEIYLYGEITDLKFWDEDITPTYVKDELDKVKDASEINIYVNSPGGSVFAGVAIYNEIKRFNRPTTAFVDGIAASIASLIVLAADKVVMPSNSMLMIHNAWTIAMGDYKDFRDLADRLEKIQDSTIVEAYMQKTGMSKEKLSQMMDDEAWLSADEAVELGFADEIEAEQKIAASYVGDNIKFSDVEVPLNQFKAFPKAKFTEHKPKTNTQKQSHEHEMYKLRAFI